MVNTTTKEDGNKTCILIIGMHRSGTSFLSRYLNHIGIEAGTNLMGPSFDNPYGFFEHYDIVALNDSILNDLRAKWDKPFLVEQPAKKKLFVSKIKNLLTQLLDSEFAEHNQFFIKDPRISIILPLWLSALSELSIPVKIIICNRPPKEIAQSLYKRNSFSTYKSYILYLQYMLSAERDSRNQERIFLNFHSNDTNFDLWVSQLSKFIKNKPVSSNALRALFDKKLHKNTDKSIEEGGKLSDLSSDLYDIVSKKELNPSEISTATNAIFEKFQSLKNALEEWIHGNQFGKILIYTRDLSIPEKTINFDVDQGLNLITLNVNIEHVNKIILFPVHNQAVVKVNQFTVGDNELEWKNLSGFKKDDQIFFDVEFPSIKLTYNDDINEIHLSFSLSSIGENIKTKIEVIRLQHDLDKLKTEHLESKIQHDADSKELLNQIELLNVLSETEKQEDYEAYNKSLEKFKETLALSSSSYDKRLLALTTSYKDAIKKHKLEIEELKSKYRDYTVELIEKYKFKRELLEIQISDQKEENQRLKLKIENKTSGLNKIKERVLQLEHGLIENKEERQKTLQLVQKQHDEIQHNKEAYGHRVNELNDISNSLSYKLGRAITWPARIIYEGFRIIGPLLATAGGLVVLILAAPSKFFASLSFKNLSTLFNALRHETPSQIIRNVRKYLSLPSSLSKIQKRYYIPNNSPSKKSILYISPNLPDFDSSAGGRRATYMIELLCEEFNVYVFTIGARPQKYSNKLTSLGAIVIQTDNHQDLYDTVTHLDTIIFGWYYTLHDNSAILKHYKNAQIILDTVDIHWVRERRSLGQVEGITEESIEKNMQIELEAYTRSDLIWTVSEEDKTAVLKELPDAKIQIVSIIYDLVVKKYRDPQNLNILFLGGYNHPPNLAAVKILAEDIFPIVLSKFPSAKLLIAGANAPQSIANYGLMEGVEFVGFVETDEMEELYKNTFLCVAPLTAGAGVKGKVCEAIAYSVPVLTTEIGNEGIGLIHEKEGFITDIDEMPSIILRVFNKEYNLEQITKSAQNKLINLMGSQVAKERMIESINQEISICIVTWNRIDLLKRCVASILEHTIYPYYKILIHSNGCTDGTQEYLKQLSIENPRVLPILSPTNDVFVLPNNGMMQQLPHNDVVLLNNDTYVTKGWLTALRNSAYSSVKNGIAGSKILYPDGVLQEFGSEIYENGTGRNIGKWDSPEKSEYLTQKFTGYVSGCSMYIKRSTINQMGYFDTKYHPCYCEDCDYSYRAWKEGIRTVVTPRSIIYHDEGGTSGTNEESGFKAYQKVNFDKFLDSHGSELSKINSLIDSLNQEILIPK